MKRKADKKRGEAIEDTEGDLVWVEGSNINSDRPAKKLAFRRAGPFPVIKKVGSSAYKLIIPKMWKSLQRVKIEALPLPNLRAATRVLANSHRPKSRGSHTKSWKNLKLQKTGRVSCQPFEESTWEDRHEIIKGASQLCRDFHKDHPDAPRVPTIRIPGKSYSKVAETRP